jgi:hypothetical protein
MAEFGLLESFGIDDGELDGLSPQACFALGVEWQKYWQWSLNYKAGVALPLSPQLLHAANLKRVLALLRKHGVPFSQRLSHDDWAEISFGESSDEGGDNAEGNA